jgi:RNA polymerase sigma-70 factor (ECF subfamily)
VARQKKGAVVTTPPEPDTDVLLEQASRGEASARQQLLVRYRKRLKRMVGLRMDRRLAARFDPSDVVQDTMITAALRLSDYLRKRPIPFYPWLRQLALEWLVDLHRKHVQSKKRTVRREAPGVLNLPDDSIAELAARLSAGGLTPGQHVLREELQRRVRAAVLRVKHQYREVLILRYVEQLDTREIASILGLTEAGVKSRHLRALGKLRVMLDTDKPES